MKNFPALLLTALLLLPIAAIPQILTVRAQAGPVIYCDPSASTYSTTNATVGTLFNVTVKVTDVPATVASNTNGSVAWQVYLEFNDDNLRVTRWYEPTTDPSYLFYGKMTSALPTPPDPGYVHLSPGKGAIQVAASLFPTPPAQDGSYGAGPFLLCILTFTIFQIPDNTTGSLTSSLHFGPADTYLLDGDASNIPDTILQDGSYNIIYVPPPPPTANIWLQTSPASFTAVVPKPFNVTIRIENVSASDLLIGAQFEIQYNNTLFEFIAGYNGSFFDPYAIHGMFWTIINEPVTPVPETGRIVFGQILLPNDLGVYDLTTWPSGNGDLAIITMRQKVHEPASVTITPQTLFGESFIDVNGNYVPAATPIGMDYTYAPLTEPTIALSPTPFIGSGVGQAANAEVTVSGLNAAWKLTHIVFRLNYNTTYLNATGATEGTFLGGFGITTFTAVPGDGFIDFTLNVVPAAAFPSGSGTLVVVTFEPIARPPATAPMTFSNTALSDPDGYEDLANWVDSSYEMHERLVHHIVIDAATYEVVTVSDAAVDPVPMLFDPDHRMLSFNVTGLGIPHFVEVTMPDALIHANPGDWLVIVDSSATHPMGTPLNASHTMLVIDYSFTNQPVFIFGTYAIPEFSPGIMPLLLVLTTLISFAIGSAAISRRKYLAALR